MIAAHRNFDVAALGDLESPLDGGRVVVEDLPHLVAVLHVEALAVELEALRVVEVGGGTDAEQRIVMGMVFVLEVVRVVRGDERDVQAGGHLDELGVHLILGGDASERGLIG